MFRSIRFSLENLFLRRLSRRFALVYILVMLISMALVSVMFFYIVISGLNTTSVSLDRTAAYRLSHHVTPLYEDATGHDRVIDFLKTYLKPVPADLLERLPRGELFNLNTREAVLQDRAILLNEHKNIIYDSKAEDSYSDFAPDYYDRAQPLVHKGEVKGYLILLHGVVGSELAADNILAIVRNSILMVLVILLSLGGLLVAILTGFISAPLKMLARESDRLAKGETSKPLPVTTEDEIGLMARSFNAMAATISEQKQLQKQMIADISHELRTPLSVMSLEAEAFLDGLQPPEKALNNINAQIARVETLVDDLRLLSMAEADALTIQTEPLSVVNCLTVVEQTWRVVANAKDIALEIRPPEQDCEIFADPYRLHQVLNNLVSNALKYSPSKTKITVYTERKGGLMKILVQDQGPGIEEDKLESVFQRFYRADASRSRETGGSGLGLAIAKRLTELQQGRIGVTSRVDEGSCFFVELPIVPGDII